LSKKASSAGAAWQVLALLIGWLPLAWFAKYELIAQKYEPVTQRLATLGCMVALCQFAEFG